MCGEEYIVFFIKKRKEVKLFFICGDIEPFFHIIQNHFNWENQYKQQYYNVKVKMFQHHGESHLGDTNVTLV